MAYALLRRAMTDENLCAVARAAVTGSEELMVLRPVGEFLSASSVDYQSEIRDPGSLAGELPHQQFSEKELELTRALVEATTQEQFDLAQFRDLRAEKMHDLIQQKVAGQKVVTAPEETPPIITLMDALRAIVAQTKGETTGKKKRASAPRKNGRKKTG